MKKHIIFLSFLLAACMTSFGQSADPLVSRCVMNAGENARYLKDFRVQLGAGNPENDFRFKVNISLWKNTKYRFTMCNADNSKGELVLTITDDASKAVLASFDEKTGRSYPYVDFTCNRSGIYQLNYDFLNRQSGSGVGVVSMIK